MATKATADGQIDFETKEIEDQDVADQIAEACATIVKTRKAVSSNAKAKRDRKDLLGVESMEVPTKVMVSSEKHGNWVLEMNPQHRDGHEVSGGTSMRIKATAQDG